MLGWREEGKLVLGRTCLMLTTQQKHPRQDWTVGSTWTIGWHEDVGLG